MPKIVFHDETENGLAYMQAEEALARYVRAKSALDAAKRRRELACVAYFKARKENGSAVVANNDSVDVLEQYYASACEAVESEYEAFSKAERSYFISFSKEDIKRWAKNNALATPKCLLDDIVKGASAYIDYYAARRKLNYTGVLNHKIAVAAFAEFYKKIGMFHNAMYAPGIKCTKGGHVVYAVHYHEYPLYFESGLVDPLMQLNLEPVTRKGVTYELALVIANDCWNKVDELENRESYVVTRDSVAAWEPHVATLDERFVDLPGVDYDV